MAEVVLDRPRVLAVVRQLVANAVTQHMAVDQEREACGLPSSRDHALIARHAQRCQALGHEDMDGARPLRCLSL